MSSSRRSYTAAGKLQVKQYAEAMATTLPSASLTAFLRWTFAKK